MTKKQFTQRCIDMLKGANSGYAIPDLDGEDTAGVVYEVGLGVFGNWLSAIQGEFFDDQRDYVFRLNNLAAFDAKLSQIIDKLWDYLPEDDS